MMKSVLLFLLSSIALNAQSYAPAAGASGSTAIAANSSVFVGWANSITLERGLVDISNPTAADNGSNYASYGVAEDALGPVSNNAVSLGDAGEAILSFSTPISNGEGFDFAVFENSFSDTFLELAFVEVSSDGINFFRFPSHSETQTDTQVGGFGNLDPTFLNNLAGKYRASFGTPFDLEDVPEDALLDKNNITHVKIIDVVGSIDPLYARYDSFGNAINDPFETPFFSGGFDLAGVGVINQQVLGIDDQDFFTVSLYPNPATTEIYIDTQQPVQVRIYDMLGKMILSKQVNSKKSIDLSSLENGIYIASMAINHKMIQHKFIKH